MKITARAPGKLVLLGEYAVLEGAPGLVMAVDRHARVASQRWEGDRLRLQAPPIQAEPLTVGFEDGRIVWPGAALPLVDAVLANLAARCDLPAALAGLSLSLDSDDFFTAGGKLGLGSSAAMTTALLGALSAAIPGLGPARLDAVLDAHQRLQRGRGSGIDVAASFYGGILSFCRQPGGRPAVEPLTWPPGLLGYGVWSGRPASTGARLARLERFAEARPDAYRTLMERLRRDAEGGVAAFASGQTTAFLAAAEAFTGTLATLDQRAGLEIETQTHRELRALAEGCGVLYKTSGAGGGDFGLVLGQERERLDRFARRAAAGSRLLLPLKTCPGGLEVTIE